MASLGLLLDQDADQDSKLAEDLHSRAASIPAFETTYAFALLKTQRTGEALQIVERLPPEAVDDPSIGLYYGLVLAANGKGEAAKPYLDRRFAKRSTFSRKKSRLARKP